LGVHYIGIRHHSPACAKLVRARIRELRPSFVLIEGPADMNGRMDELLLEHELPIAVFSYRQRGPTQFASWSPFCDYSPEWVAIREAAAVGAEARFIDLPAWDEAFGTLRNRYSDGERRSSLAVKRLAERLDVEGLDALWDTLFEGVLETNELGARLDAYFEGLRGADACSERDQAREAYMAACIAHYAKQAQDSDVLVVTGGFHKPALERLVPTLDGESLPELPEAEPDERRGSFLVPYSFRRLDSFVGYESGMPSPAYYQMVWESGPEHASEQVMSSLVKRLRSTRRPLSSADLIAARTMALGLARLRGRDFVARIDLLDGLSAALVKDAQEVPPPWSERGPMRAGTDPILVEAVASLSGMRRGTLHASTPRPPLAADVNGELLQHELLPTAARRELSVDLTRPEQLAKSRVLHRLAILGIAGFARRSGPVWGTDPTLEERWEISDEIEREPTVIEASAYGATLEGAAVACLEEQASQSAGDMAALAGVLSAATFIGVESFGARILSELRSLVGQEHDLSRLGAALSQLLALYRHDTLLGSARSVLLGAVIDAAYTRGLWLVEGVTGGGEVDTGVVWAVAALRDTLRFAGQTRGLDATAADAVMTRRAADVDAPFYLRGAALGFRWSLHDLTLASGLGGQASRTMQRVTDPAQLGDWLAGLFALAREEVLSDEERADEHTAEDDEHDSVAAPTSLVASLDARFASMPERDYLLALPALRLAFGYFPPRERERIAARVLRVHGHDPSAARTLLTLPTSPEKIAACRALEREVDAREARYGLGPSEGS